MTILGVDTSNHDIIDRNGGNNLDWAAIARAGAMFCWHKVSDGLNFYADPTASMALTSMRAVLPVWGGYHVLWGNRSITGQLDWFASILDRTTPGWRADPRFVAVWDCEPFSYNTAPSIDQVNQAGDYWLHTTGRPSLAYCPPWVYGADLNRLRYPLISSAYGKNDPGPLADLYPGDGTSRWQATPQRQADVLQYGSRTVVGPHSDMDADAFRGTLDQLRALITGDDDQMKTVLVRLAGGDGRVWLSNGVVRYHIDKHLPQEPGIADGPQVLRDVIGGVNPVLGSLVDTTVHDVQDLDAFGAEIPADLAGRLDGLAAAVAGLQGCAAPTQDQVDAAVLKALSDPGVQAGIGAAIASHLHVT